MELAAKLPNTRFLALDFETANHQSDSACSIGLVRVENGKIVQRECHLIRPPSSRFSFTWVHGLTWAHVKESPHFGDLWPKIEPLFDDVDFIAAHNVGFDRRVLSSCCERYGLRFPERQFLCTVQLARSAWQIFPTRLSDVCRKLSIPLNHHEALSDAEACAKIVMEAMSQGRFDGMLFD